ncbi:DUF2959 family protein [Geomesophilobacter sediminis]|uniref:DUF2959 family protein n=1 Tax=Geomesophilobacter sediminis TaxID=2798584 RepID=A0A8J7LYP8_9BACT|nr:DUF2959 family protein [Geomesophilobacter sediminis]MBJ6725227.1 DUF2959 family protein [Geomesophilobacter sediminis]
MKSGARFTVCFILFLLATVVFWEGCATTGMSRSVKASNSIQQVDSDIRELIVQIDTTGASLDALVLVDNPDLKKSFDAYTKDLANLDTKGKKVIIHMEEMKVRSTEYFTEWERQGETYTNPQIRELSDERRNKLASIYAQVPEAGIGVKRAYLDYLSDLKEIQQFLSNDLTPKGIQAIDPVAKKSVQDREAFKTSLGPVIVALDNIKAELYTKKQ